MDLKVVLIIESKVVPCQNLFDQFYEVFCMELLENSRAEGFSACFIAFTVWKFVYSDVTSRVTRRVSSGKLIGKDCSFNRKSVVSLG